MAGPVPSLDAATILDVRDAGRLGSATRRGALLFRLCEDEAAVADPLDVPVGRRDAALIALRRTLFGSRFDCVADCVSCGETIEIAFEADDIRAVPAAADAIAEIVADDATWRVRAVTCRDLLAIEALRESHAARDRLVDRCLVGAHAAPSDRAATAIATAAAALDPQAEIVFETRCPMCDAPAVLPFDIVPYLWTEIDRWAEDMLDDVHALAGAYGWGEAAILALPPARRIAYLERAGFGAAAVS